MLRRAWYTLWPSITLSGRAKYTYSKMHAADARAGTPCSAYMPSRLKRTISPGSTSRTYCAPTMSRPHVSLDTAQPRPSGSAPMHSGRMPFGSRNAYSESGLASTMA